MELANMVKKCTFVIYDRKNAPIEVGGALKKYIAHVQC